MKSCEACNEPRYCLVEYRQKTLCFGCEEEYRMIFDGSLVSSDPKGTTTVTPLPPQVQDYFRMKFFGEPPKSVTDEDLK